MGASIVTLTTENFSPLDGAGGFIVSGTLTLSASYAAGGDSITPAQLAAGEIKFMNIETAAVPGNSAAGGIIYRYEPSTSKVMAFQQNPPGVSAGPLTEVVAGTNLTTFVGAFQANCM